MSSYVKDPGESLRYSYDFAPLLETGETISAFAVTASTGITVGTGTKGPASNGAVVTVWLEAGTVGERYTVTFRITTSVGQIYERSIRLLVEDR